MCDALKEVGRQISGPDFPDNSLDRVDGFQNLGLVTEFALRWFLQGSDPDFPRFISLNRTPELADNRFAAVRPDAEYRISGNIGTLFDLNISLHSGWDFEERHRAWGDLTKADLEITAGGSFEIIVAAQQHKGNWLPLPAAAKMIQIREYFYDWTTQKPGQFEIVRIGSEGQAPPRRSQEELAARLQFASEWVKAYIEFHSSVAERVFPNEPNIIATPSRTSRGSNNVQYGRGRFLLDIDQALLVEFRPPAEGVWSVQWQTERWYANPDMANRITSITGADAVVCEDGIARVIVASKDPGLHNWLDCTGYKSGLLIARWLWAQDTPGFACRVISMDTISSVMPPEMHADAADRLVRQRRRRSHLALRKR